MNLSLNLATSSIKKKLNQQRVIKYILLIQKVPT